jgi:hypothetical protein
MNRRALLLWILGGCLVTTALLLLFTEYVELETFQEKGEMSPEAQRNDWLAVERLFTRMGRKTRQIKSPVALDALPEGGVLFLRSLRGQAVDKARAQKILDWVARGGYLIVERSGAVEDDPLLAAFGVTDDDDATERPGAVRYERGQDASDSLAFIEARLPGHDQGYRLASRYTQEIKPGEETSAKTPLWQVENEEGSVMLHYAWGRGNVTLASRLGFLDNDELGDFDHAEFFWALLQRYQPGGVLCFATQMQFPTLWEWLSKTAWRVLLSAAALILLWLFWVVPRFGGVRAAPEAERRGLAEHLLALGRCLWRENALGALREAARREIAYRLARRHPGVARLFAAEKTQALARQSGLAAVEIDAALHDNAPPSPETFTRAMQITQSLERVL